MEMLYRKWVAHEQLAAAGAEHSTVEDSILFTDLVALHFPDRICHELSAPIWLSANNYKLQYK